MRSGLRVLCPNEPDPTSANLCALAIMTKAPRAGHVKTRLTPPLSADEAAALNISFLRDLARSIGQAGDGARGIGCYTPVGAEEVHDDILPDSFQLIAQRDGDFGQRLMGAVEDLLSVGFAAVCLINSDSPTAPSSVFAEAARVLAAPNDKLVLGPSEDGGYYLIGMKTSVPVSSKKSIGVPLRSWRKPGRAPPRFGLQVHLLPPCYDIDDRRMLWRLCQDLFGPNDSENREMAPATRRLPA